MCEVVSLNPVAKMPSGSAKRLALSGAIALIAMLTLVSQAANAQVLFGSMVGNVTDPSGAAVPGASVKVTNVATNDVLSATSNDAGVYTIADLNAGTYRVEVTKEGFRTFVATSVLVNQNNVVRVNAGLQVGTSTETVEVTAEAAALQTDRADVHAEVSSRDFDTLPLPNRTYGAALETVPGAQPPAGQLAGGTNNPSKGNYIAFNGNGFNSATVRIDGVAAIQPWNTSATNFVPSNEAIENINVVTNGADSEQGFADGASVNIRLKSGGNDVHGAAFAYNIVNKFEANNFFANQAGSKIAHLVNNADGASIGGHIIRNKLFYFGSYDGDYLVGANSAILSLPNATMLSGNETGSNNPIYDPATGNSNGTGRTPFPGNTIPLNRFDPVVVKLLPHFPAVTYPNLAVNNDFINQGNVYNLHKIDTKFDYIRSQKLRMSYRWGKQPYYSKFDPIYGDFLGGSGGFAACGACNYLQNGATVAQSGSATYIISPTFVVDGTFGETASTQYLYPTQANQRAGQDLGIPGANTGPLPWSGGLPNFAFTNTTFVTFGYSYPALSYYDPVFEWTGNATKTIKSHTIRFGTDIIRQHENHYEVRPTIFTFSGNATALNGGPGANPYNQIADFLLGQATTLGNYVQYIFPLTERTWEDSLYVHDQWQVNRKLTVNYGLRWELYPVPTQATKGISMYRASDNTIQECGVGGFPGDCGIKISHKLFSPSIGIAYRLGEDFVIRAGYSLSPQQDDMARFGIQGYPDEAQSTINGATSFTPAGTVSGTGAPVIPAPVFTNGRVVVPAGTGNLDAQPTNFVRGYIQSYNLTLQKQFKGGFTVSAGYVGQHSVHLFSGINFNYGTLGGGAASQPLNQYGITATANLNEPFGNATYNSLQSTIRKRLSRGLYMQMAFTYSKVISETASILAPGYTYYDHYLASIDRTFTIPIAYTYELPFGKGRQFARSGPLSWIVGGWDTSGIFTHYSGSPYTVTAATGSCNCPGSSQTANLVGTANVVGSGVGGQPYFNPLAYAPVNNVAFGTSGFDQLRGPGMTDLDMSLIRNFILTKGERLRMQIRADSINVSNTPHFANPGANVSNYVSPTNLGGFSQITATQNPSRLLDQRYFRFGLRFMF
jgi:hypothetical protein